ncbi:MAG: hypothetical protein LBD50_03645 [Rickettsiales bacterium]|jgi:hypothetical protein|nr:hypothetical protein [Rickettsiales bacterium]
MAQKTVKKTAAGKVAAKKSKTYQAKATQPAAAMAQPSCACGSGCKCGGFGRFVKKLIVFLVIFGLGFAACLYCCGTHRQFRKDFFHPEFVNGCFDASKIKCPEMLGKLNAADANADGCITKEEFRAIKKNFRKGFHNGNRDFHKSCDKSQEAGESQE